MKAFCYVVRFIKEQWHMWKLVLCAAIALITGCTTQLKPESSIQPLYKTPIKNATAQVVVSRDFQMLQIRQKPTFGTSWQAHTFVAPVGRPLTDSLVTQLKSVIPATRVGDRDDGAPANVKIIPQTLEVSFGVDDGKATGMIGALGVLGMGVRADVKANVTLSSQVIYEDGQSKSIRVTGEAVNNVLYLSISTGDLSVAIGQALDAAAGNLVGLVEQDVLRH